MTHLTKAIEELEDKTKRSFYHWTDGPQYAGLDIQNELSIKTANQAMQIIRDLQKQRVMLREALGRAKRLLEPHYICGAWMSEALQNTVDDKELSI